MPIFVAYRLTTAASCDTIIIEKYYITRRQKVNQTEVAQMVKKAAQDGVAAHFDNAVALLRYSIEELESLKVDVYSPRSVEILGLEEAVEYLMSRTTILIGTVAGGFAGKLDLRYREVLTALR